MDDKKFKQMVDEALDNWSFEAADNGKDLRAALEYMSREPEGLARVFTDNYQGIGDKWTALDEMATVYASLLNQ